MTLCSSIPGWEYTVEATLGGYGPVEKTYHMCRRRRWVRSRKLVKDMTVIAQEVSGLDSLINPLPTKLFNLNFQVDGDTG